MKARDLEALVAARAERRAVALVTPLGGGTARVVDAKALGSETDDALREALSDALLSDRARTVESRGTRLFVQPHNPPLRLAIVGAVHIAQHLASFAARAGYEVIVIDPRSAFASEARFPGVALSHEWPDAALDALQLGERDAVVTLTHDPKLDDPALERALRSSCFYIGALGSRRTQARRAERLRDLGHDDRALARIHGPVGLDLGARSPAEIAVSVLAQITERLRRPETRP